MGFRTSKVVQYFHDYRGRYIKTNINIWSTGFEIEPGEATVHSWFEAKMPVFNIDKNQLSDISVKIRFILECANSILNQLLYCIKQAWFKPRKINGKETWKHIDNNKFNKAIEYIKDTFWNTTEYDFYVLLKLTIQKCSEKVNESKIYTNWFQSLKEKTYNLFDQWVLAQQEDGLDMKRIVKARNNLRKAIGKVFKELNNLKEGGGK